MPGGRPWVETWQNLLGKVTKRGNLDTPTIAPWLIMLVGSKFRMSKICDNQNPPIFREAILALMFELSLLERYPVVVGQIPILVGSVPDQKRSHQSEIHASFILRSHSW